MPFGDKKDAWLNYKTYNLALIGHRHSSSRIVIGFEMFPMCTLDLSRCLWVLQHIQLCNCMHIHIYIYIAQAIIKFCGEYCNKKSNDRVCNIKVAGRLWAGFGQRCKVSSRPGSLFWKQLPTVIPTPSSIVTSAAGQGSRFLSNDHLQCHFEEQTINV